MPSCSEAGEEQTGGKQGDGQFGLRGAEGGGHLGGWPYGQHATKFAKGGDFVFVSAQSRGVEEAPKKEKKQALKSEMPRDWAETLKNPREGVVAGGG